MVVEVATPSRLFVISVEYKRRKEFEVFSSLARAIDRAAGGCVRVARREGSGKIREPLLPTWSYPKVTVNERN